ncbi:MAG TPA: hypothetical protein VKB49_25625 [Candidatus Sulfotelmatobacter sp.]|nr:hypothetical protein [Candidatus Sulfotelmatobacter sp.]
MKRFAMLLLLGIAVTAYGQDKPRVFVQGKGSENVASKGSGGGGSHWAAWGSKSTIDSHDESMEVTKDLQNNCSGVMVTINENNADYIVMLNRESKQNRGLLRSNSQIQVANKAGDVLGAKATHTVGNAAKDACNLIVADWQAHGPMNAPQQSAAPAPQAPAVQPAVQTAPAAQLVQSAPVVAAEPAPAAQVSIADAAKQEKQRRACLELAKDNPSIVCK